jgi:hypothetical protein
VQPAAAGPPSASRLPSASRNQYDPNSHILMAKPLDTSYYDKHRQAWLADEQARAEYKRARHEIEQIDAVIRSLDEPRVDAGMSKAELARRVGRPRNKRIIRDAAVPDAPTPRAQP